MHQNNCLRWSQGKSSIPTGNPTKSRFPAVPRELAARPTPSSFPYSLEHHNHQRSTISPVRSPPIRKHRPRLKVSLRLLHVRAHSRRFIRPALPGKLLLQGSYSSDLKLMVSHNANETAYFVDPSAVSKSDIIAGIHSQLPDAQPSIVDYITNTLYPYIFNTSLYADPWQLRDLSSAEVSFTCNTRFLASEFSNRTWAYRFSIPPAVHGQDVAWTYYNSSLPSPQIDPGIAAMMQAYITEFAVSGNPNRKGLPEFPVYGSKATLLDFNVTGVALVGDDTDNERCAWWQKALYF